MGSPNFTWFHLHLRVLSTLFRNIIIEQYWAFVHSKQYKHPPSQKHITLFSEADSLFQYTPTPPFLLPEHAVRHAAGGVGIPSSSDSQQ